MFTVIFWFLVLVSGWIAGFIAIPWIGWWSVLGFIGLFIATFLYVYFGLAPKNFFFTFVEEGTAKIVVKGGEFKRALVQWAGYTFDDNWNITRGKDGWHPFGGLRVYGVWPIWDIYGYRLRWSNIHEDGKVEQHDEVLDSVMLKDMIYFAKIEGAEDISKIPLDIELVITLRVVNPYKALFVAQDWLELVLNRMRPLFREHVAGVAFEDLVKEKQKVGGDLWKKLLTEGLIQEFKDDYGIKIKEGGIEMKSISPPAEYQKAATQKYLAARESEKRAGETVGALIDMMALSTGKTPEQVKKEINKSSRIKKEFRLLCQDLIHRRMAIDGKSYLDIRVTGAEGPQKSLLELIAAWKKIPQPQKSEKGEKAET